MRIFRYLIGVFGLNLATIILGLTYLIFTGESVFWDFNGWLFLISWTGAITLPMLVSRVVDIRTPVGKRINRVGYVTLGVLGVAILCMFSALLQLSIATSNAISEIGGILALLYGSFFGCTTMNSLFAFIMLKQSKTSLNSTSPSREEKMNATDTRSVELSGYRKFVHIGVMLICAGAVGGMIYFAILSLVGTHLGVLYSVKLKLLTA